MSDRVSTLSGFTCPVPLSSTERVLLGHGSGGKLSADLLQKFFLPAFDNPILSRLDDQAIVTVNGSRLAFRGAADRNALPDH